ncbi:MAG: CvfD/Ygs/GSP13 family RNA-binding post-transcriptional regulator [Erysipelotrichaceae bacterium]
MDYKIGDIVLAKVIGIQPYGAFVKIDEEYSGLIHISEISEGFVKDVRRYINEDDIVKGKIIDIDEDKKQIRLSIKAVSSLRRHKYFYYHNKMLPDNEIGFSSIENMLPIWVKERQDD